MTSYFRSGCSDLDEIWYRDAEWHADYGKWSRSKPKVEFQYGWRLFFKNGSSYISAANWDMSTKFSFLIDVDLLKAAISTNAKPEIVLSGRHLDKAIWRYISAVAAPIWTKFVRLMQNKMQITGKWSRSKPEVEFQYGGRLFFQTRSRYISAINWSRRNLVCW